MAKLKQLDLRENAQFQKGVTAFHAGLPDQPKDKLQGTDRLAWFQGYVTARTNTRMERIFQKYNLEPLPL